MRTPWPLLLGLLVSCTGAEEERGIIDLGGRTFVSESLVGRTLVPGTEIRLGFRSTGACSATAGCSSMTGVCRFDDEVLVVAAMEMTAIGCDPARQEQDNWLAGFLLAHPTTDVAEPRITLTKDLTTLTLLDREIASPDRPLVGTQWNGSGIDAGAGRTAPAASNLSVSFGPEGQFTAFSGCKRATGNIIAEKGMIYFTALTYDSGICPDSDLEPQSLNFLFVLNGMEVNYVIEERELKISRAGMSLYFTAAQ